MLNLMCSKKKVGIGMGRVLAVMSLLIPLTATAELPMVQLTAQSGASPKIVRGVVRGTVGLHNIVGNRDRQQQRCMGYGSVSPDYQFVVPKGRSTVTLQVRSAQKDSTLAIKGPNNAVFCADDSDLGKDAGIKLENLQPGLYQVWVGAFDPGQNFAYTLTIQ